MSFTQIKGWKGFVLFFIFLEALTPFLIDYKHDRIGVIVFIHAFPILLIGIIFRFGGK